VALQGRPAEALRRRALNHRVGLWLKTVVLNDAGKGAALDRVRCGPGRCAMTERSLSFEVSKTTQLTSNPRLEPCLGMSLGDIRLLPRYAPPDGESVRAEFARAHRSVSARDEQLSSR